jgi:GGDEF domain-containing protein
MSKRLSWFFLLASGVFFLFVIGLTGYRVESARTRNAALARERSSLLAARVMSLRDITGGYDAPQFKVDMRSLFTAEPRLLMIALHSPRDGILYFIARDKSYLASPEKITAEWRGTPAYRVNGRRDLLVSASLRDGGSGAILDTLFSTMGREDLFPIARDDLYLFLAFLLVCGVGILILLSVQQEPARAPVAPAKGPAPAAHARAASSMEAAPPASGSPPPREQSDRSLVSPRSGLVYAEHLDPRLNTELERASSSDQDISLARIRIDEPFIDARLPLVYAEIARILKDSYPLHDLIFETGKEGYTILMPDNDVDAAVRTLEKVRTKVSGSTVEGRTRTVSIGISSRGGRLIEEHVLIEEADVAVAKASREGGDQVIGFRADASRFRAAL